MSLRLTLSGSVGGRNAKFVEKYVFYSADPARQNDSKTPRACGTSAKATRAYDDAIRPNRVADQLPPLTTPPTHFVRFYPKEPQRNGAELSRALPVIRRGHGPPSV